MACKAIYNSLGLCVDVASDMMGPIAFKIPKADINGHVQVRDCCGRSTDAVRTMFTVKCL